MIPVANLCKERWNIPLAIKAIDTAAELMDDDVHFDMTKSKVTTKTFKIMPIPTKLHKTGPPRMVAKRWNSQYEALLYASRCR